MRTRAIEFYDIKIRRRIQEGMMPWLASGGFPEIEKQIGGCICATDIGDPGIEVLTVGGEVEETSHNFADSEHGYRLGWKI